MSSVNKVILIGRIGRDPEVRNMPNGKANCTLSLATSKTWKDKDSGEKKEATEWHRVVLFDRLAEIAGQYVKKGSQVYFEGELKTRKWTNKEGQEVYTTEIVAQQMTLLGGKPEGGGDGRDGNNGSANRPAAARPQQRQAQEDDIPF